jgi:hypothetical protein
MGWRELRHGFDRQLSFAQQSVGQLLVESTLVKKLPSKRASRASRAALFTAEGVDHLIL